MSVTSPELVGSEQTAAYRHLRTLVVTPFPRRSSLCYTSPSHFVIFLLLPSYTSPAKLPPVQKLLLCPCPRAPVPRAQYRCRTAVAVPPSYRRRTTVVPSPYRRGASVAGDEKPGLLTCSVHSAQPAPRADCRWDDFIKARPTGRRLNCRHRRLRRGSRRGRDWVRDTVETGFEKGFEAGFETEFEAGFETDSESWLDMTFGRRCSIQGSGRYRGVKTTTAYADLLLRYFRGRIDGSLPPGLQSPDSSRGARRAAV